LHTDCVEDAVMTRTTLPTCSSRSCRAAALIRALPLALAPALALTLSLMLALPQSAVAQADDSRPDAAALRRDGPFMAHLLLTPDEAALRRHWAEAAAAGAGAQPRLEATDTAAPGRSVSAVVIFTGCAPGAGGHCDVAVEYALQQRDGTRAALGSGVLWSQPPHTPRFMLGTTSLKLAFGTQDRGARLRVLATVTDRVAGRSVALSAPLSVE
jgi:hypothetical protein